MTTIQCACGAIAVELRADPIAQFYCHCDDCQQAEGRPYMSASMYPADAVVVVRGEPITFTLKVNPRRRCGQCKTSLFAEPPGYGVRGVNAELLPAGVFRPMFHIQCRFAVTSLPDGLPRFKGLPAIFGGSDELADA